MFSLIWLHVNENEKKILEKKQNLNFQQSLYNFGRGHEFLGVNLLRAFRGHMVAC